MSKPDVESYVRAQRLGMYLVGAPRIVMKYNVQNVPELLTVWVDTDFAGCQVTGKSTSGGVAMLGNHCLKTWSSTQEVVALSSGEAELYGIVKGTTYAIGIRSLLEDLGVQVQVVVHTDASAAIGIVKRRGVGKVRRIEVKELWIQDKVHSGEVEVRKVKSSENLADVFATYINHEKMETAMYKMGFETRGSRHEFNPMLDVKR